MTAKANTNPCLRIVETNEHGVFIQRPPGAKFKKLFAALTPAAVDDPSEDDRRWFEAHHGATYRVRPPFPGEETLGDAPPGWHVAAVHVWQLGPGVRIRASTITPFDEEQRPAHSSCHDENDRSI